MKDIDTWLEKQGKQKHTNNHFTPEQADILDKHIDKFLEQKSDDKVEPKFKDGDWVIYNNDICQIVKREEGCNKLVTIFGIEKELVNERNLSTARLWTIQDAKDGDVLAHGNLPFIFKKIDTNKYSYAYCGISVYYGFKIESDGESGEWTWMQDIKPATKEQRDTLMKAMDDAGYTFNFEKKELKKIEQKSAWSEEDEHEVAILEAYIYSNDWSEAHINRALGIVDELVNKVKSIKPQPTWKPTKEQIEALWDVYEGGEKQSALASLYNDLKKL